MSETTDFTETRATLDALLTRAVTANATDVHISAGAAVYFRIRGAMLPQRDERVPPPEETAAFAREIANRSGKTDQLELCSIDGAISTPDGVRFRYNTYRRQGTWSIAFRRLEDTFHSLGDLGLPTDLYNLCGLNDGLILLAGPTGSGKSTTLAALIDQINQTRRCHIVTIEDPIEYLHTPSLSLVTQRQIGSDATSFNEALVAALRQDPDVILVGEIRDLSTMRTALTAAETGHLVFTTIHASDCVGAIERLVSVFPADEQPAVRRQLAFVLRAIIAQQLLVVDGPGKDAAHRNRQISRVPIAEILHVRAGVSHLIANGRGPQIYTVIETGANEGMQTFDSDLARLWANQQISELTATSRAKDPSAVRERYHALRQKTF